MARVIDTRRNIPLNLRLHAEIARLRTSRDYRRPLQEPSCARDTPPGLVSRTFHYRDGRIVEVKLHAKVMVGLMRAMLRAPGIMVTADADSPYSGSYRSFEQQAWLRDQYLHHGGHQAADPCDGYHRQARAVDLDPLSVKEKRAMEDVRVDGQQFFNGASFGDPPHWSFGAKG